MNHPIPDMIENSGGRSPYIDLYSWWKREIEENERQFEEARYNARLNNIPSPQSST